MEWIDWLRLLSAAGMAYGAWRAWKARPKPVVLERRRYYPYPDGVWRTFWGLPVRDEAVLAALAARHAEAPGTSQVG